MSRTIDERVVSMQFDNRQFERNVSTSMSTLDKLKQKLNFTGASKGLEDINNTASKMNMSVLSNAVDTVRERFSALEIMGVTALANITNSAVNAGKRIVSALTIDPIKTGFSEYETQINAVQTILANTQSKGTTLTDVNRALDELNTYADKTIYNFTEMTRNIGTFTAAGIELDTATNAIQGIANLAAVSGSNAQQASTAMYQLSQALASGTVKLMDWNSVVNAGMGGQVFQDALKETARVHGINIDAMIKKQGSFRETLQEGWLTSEILTETLNKFTMTTEGLTDAQIEANREMLKAKGYTNEQIDEIFKLGNTATQAATKVKTLTQLWDTLKEAAQSGWTQSWEIIVGDFDEAKELYTKISDSVGEILNKSAEARNKVLGEGLSSGWKQFLGETDVDEGTLKDAIIKSAKESGVAIDELIEKNGSFEKSLKEGWLSADILKDAVGDLHDKVIDLTDEELKNIGITKEQANAMIELGDRVWEDGTLNVEEYTKKMTQLSGRQNIIEGVTNILKALADAIKPIPEAFKEIFPPMTGEQLYNITEKIREFTEKLKVTDEVASKIKRAFKGLFSIFDMFKKVIVAVLKPIGQLLGSEGVGSLASLLLDATAGIGDFFTALNEGFDTTDISGSFSKIVTVISDVLKGATTGIRSFGDIFSKIGEVILKVAGKIGEAIQTVFGFISDNFSAADIFAGLAGGGIFAVATKLFGLLSNIKKTLGDGGIMALLFGKKDDDEGGEKITDKFKEILGSVNETLQSFTSGIKVASVVAIAVAIGILTASLRKLSEINVPNLMKSLTAMGVMMTMLSKTLKSMLKSIKTFDSKGIAKTSFSLILIATAMNILAKAIDKIGKLSLKQIAKGLIGVGGGLTILVQGVKAIKDVKIPLRTSISIIALAKACDVLGEALKKFGEMTWNEIARGLVAMGGALGELVAAVSILNKFGGGKSIFGAVAIDIVILGLSKLANALKKFGEINWDEIGRGLTAMGGALSEVTIALIAAGKIAGFSGIIGSIAIDIVIAGLGKLAGALSKFGKMSWEEIARGLTTMCGALLEVSLFSGALGMIAGFSGILGGVAIDITIAGLGKLAYALGTFGSMSWDEIGRGLVAMGGALLEVSIISGGLGAIAGLAGILGGTAIWVSVQGLGDLADALKKFGEMSWDEINRGLNSMANALNAIAMGGFLNTLSIIGSFSIAKMAKPLGDLADSMKKWMNVEIPSGLGLKLGSLALGVSAFTFDGLGAGALALMAKPLGDLANSVKEWSGVTVPEGLSEQLKSLAPGIEAFTFGGFGADVLTEAALAIGQLATSISKWNNVTVPEDIGEKLKNIATGVKEFTWGFMGGWTISSLIQPLTDLPRAFKAWEGVKAPSTIKTDLTNIANGIKQFSWAFMGGWSINTIIEPLKNLPDALTKWKGVAIPTTIKTDLTNIAEGIKAFGFMWGADINFANITSPMKQMASALVQWGYITVSSTIKDDLIAVSDGIKSFKDSGDISGTAMSLTVLALAITRFTGVDFYGIANGISHFVTTVAGLNSESSAISQLGTNIMNGIVNGLTDGIGRLQAAMNSITSIIMSSSQNFAMAGISLMQNFRTGIVSQKGGIISSVISIITAATSSITGKTLAFRTAGSSLMTSLKNGIDSEKSNVISAVKSVVEACTAIVTSVSLYDAGIALVDGFASGITEETFAAEAAARAMAEAALEAAREALDINSPSKVFRKLAYSVPEGFAQGIDKMQSVVKASAVDMAKTAINSTKTALVRIGSVANKNVDIIPTIRPVVDLDAFDVRTIQLGANIDASIGGTVDSLSSIIADAQNEINASNNEVITAINGLRADINAIYNGEDQEVALYVDGKKLASTLAKPMNRQLNILSKRGAY